MESASEIDHFKILKISSLSASRYIKMNLQAIDGCIDETGIFEAIKDIIRDNSVSPAEDYFNGNVLGLTKNPNGERYITFYK